MGAQPASQALSDDQVHRRRDIERCHAHITQAGQSLSCAVGVQGGHYHVPRLRRLDGNLCRLQVPDLTHHDDIRVLTQEGAQCLGEIQPLLGIDVNLVDPLQVDLYRVFCGGDITLDGVENIQTSV